MGSVNKGTELIFWYSIYIQFVCSCSCAYEWHCWNAT